MSSGDTVQLFKRLVFETGLVDQVTRAVVDAVRESFDIAYRYKILEIVHKCRRRRLIRTRVGYLLHSRRWLFIANVHRILRDRLRELDVEPVFSDVAREVVEKVINHAIRGSKLFLSVAVYSGKVIVARPIFALRRDVTVLDIVANCFSKRFGRVDNVIEDLLLARERIYHFMMNLLRDINDSLTMAYGAVNELFTKVVIESRDKEDLRKSLRKAGRVFVEECNRFVSEWKKSRLGIVKQWIEDIDDPTIRECMRHRLVTAVNAASRVLEQAFSRVKFRTRCRVSKRSWRRKQCEFEVRFNFRDDVYNDLIGIVQEFIVRGL